MGSLGSPDTVRGPWPPSCRRMLAGPEPRPNPTGDETPAAQKFSDTTADSEGTLYVAWIGSHDEDPAGRGLGLARSMDFGKTWEFSQLADPSSCACYRFGSSSID